MDGQTTFTLGEAAKEIGKSKATLSKALKSGKLSYREKTESGYVIEASELFRAFPVNTKNKKATVQTERSETPNETGGLQVKLEILEQERGRERKQYEDTIEDLRKRLDNSEQQRDDLVRRLDAESEERRRLTERLLPAPSKPSEGLFRKLGQFFSGG